jgi:hypothetical protein
MTTTAEAPSEPKQLTFFNLPVIEPVSRFDKQRLTRRSNYEERKKKICDRFNQLYKEGKRVDDVIYPTLAKEFDCAISTIKAAIRN